MISKQDTNKARIQRHKRVRAKISGTAERPRLCVYRSNANISAQVIDDVAGVTLVSATSTEKDFGMYGGKEEAVWLKCENSASGIISDRFGSDLRFIKADENHFKVRVNVIVSPLFFSWIVGMNGKIVIDSPESTVAEFRSLIKKIEAEYPEKS